MTARQQTPLESALVELRAATDPVHLTLPLPGSRDQQRVATEMVRQLDDYVLPRLATIDAPMLAVVGGSTGAGKSTLVNSLLGRRVTAPGVIRPTTRAPVLVHHSNDARWFTDERILPGLARSTGSSADARSLQLVVDDSMPSGLAILDAPDIDSVVAENRELAAQLLAAADLWLFVTSAARYADAVPWDFLASAADRSAAVAVVLDRVPPRAMAEVPAHLGQLMSERGLADSPLFAVPETSVDADGLLPAAAVQPVRSWLATLAADQASRAAVVHRTLDGAIGALAANAPRLAAAVDAQVGALSQLRAEADHSYAEAVRTVQVQTADGTLLRGEVLARWHEFVGTGEFFRALEQKVSWLRDRLVSTFRGEPMGARNLQVAVESGVESLLRQEADAAAERAEGAWQANAAGRELLTRSPADLSRASESFAGQAARAIRDWQGAVLDLVADEGMTKRARARFLALGVNGVGVALMIVVFAHTGGLVGAEVGVAGGTAILAQRVLEAVFGDQAIRRLANTAKEELDGRVAAAVQPVRSWLATLAADQASRAAVVHRTLDGAIGALAANAPRLAAAVDAQVGALSQLRAEADHSYAEAVRTVQVQTADGTLLRGEVLARWHEFVGTGEFFRALEQKVSWLRDRVVSTFRGEPMGARNLQVAVESGVESLLRQEADAAAERAEGAWQANAAGRELLTRSPADLSRASEGFGGQAARAIRDWQGAVLDLVADEGMTKRARARFLALGVNGVGVALMIVVFAHTGGLVGAEVGVAGGTAILAQRVLEAVFGDQAIRRLAKTAKEELDGRVQALMAGELVRFHRLLDEGAPTAEQAQRLRVAAASVQNARGAGLPRSVAEPPAALPSVAPVLAISGPVGGEAVILGSRGLGDGTDEEFEGEVVEAEILDDAEDLR